MALLLPPIHFMFMESRGPEVRQTRHLRLVNPLALSQELTVYQRGNISAIKNKKLRSATLSYVTA